MSTWIAYALTAGIVFLGCRYVLLTASRGTRLPLPPGPRRHPILGNISDLPTKNPGPAFRSINEKHGDVAHLSLLGGSMIVLGSYSAACALLETRSANTSDRKASVMADLTGYGSWEFALLGYGTPWRRQRRAFHQQFHQGAIERYQPIQRQQTVRFLQRLLDRPESFFSHIRHFFGATIMRIVYGIDVAEENDKYISMAERGVDIFKTIIVPGRYLVEAIPLLQYIPSWFPGSQFKRDAARWREEVEAVRNTAFNAVLDEMAKGSHTPSVVSSMLERAQKLPEPAASEQADICRNVSAIAYLTGADTTLSSVQAFFLAMAMHPEIQRKAQTELDAVVGAHRLPDFSDRASLPYVNAIVKECFRWNVVVPLGLPHRVMEDDELNGYLIPKGSVIVANAWAISRDPAMYPDPETFRPERFLDPSVLDPHKYFFGFGRRICPGRHFADASLFIAVASVLHVLNIEPPTDEQGRPCRVEAKFVTEQFLSYPAPFECKISPRSPDATELVRRGGP